MKNPNVQVIKAALADSYGYYDAFYDLSDAFVVESLKETIKDISDIENDPFETPDNRAANVSAFYRVLSFYTTSEDYDQFVLEMRDKRETSY